VKRFKYKDQTGSGAFLIQHSKEETIVATTVEQSSVNAGRVYNKTEESEKMLWVMKTSQPDVYNLIDDDGNKVGIACCNTMSTSKLLSKVFQNSGPATKMKMACRFHEKFQKWEPVHLIA
jgi:hypothetical protein